MHYTIIHLLLLPPTTLAKPLPRPNHTLRRLAFPHGVVGSRVRTGGEGFGSLPRPLPPPPPRCGPQFFNVSLNVLLNVAFDKKDSNWEREREQERPREQDKTNYRSVSSLLGVMLLKKCVKFKAALKCRNDVSLIGGLCDWSQYRLLVCPLNPATLLWRTWLAVAQMNYLRERERRVAHWFLSTPRYSLTHSSPVVCWTFEFNECISAVKLSFWIVLILRYDSKKQHKITSTSLSVNCK